MKSRYYSCIETAFKTETPYPPRAASKGTLSGKDLLQEKLPEMRSTLQLVVGLPQLLFMSVGQRVELRRKIYINSVSLSTK